MTHNQVCTLDRLSEFALSQIKPSLDYEQRLGALETSVSNIEKHITALENSIQGLRDELDLPNILRFDRRFLLDAGSLQLHTFAPILVDPFHAEEVTSHDFIGANNSEYTCPAASLGSDISPFSAKSMSITTIPAFAPCYARHPEGV